MRKYDLTSFFGILRALLAIIGGQLLEGGKAGSLFQITAFVIVIGGTLGAIMLQNPLAVFLRGIRMAKWAFVPPQQDAEYLIQQVADWSNIARRGGLLALEPAMDNLNDPFAKRGLQMVFSNSAIVGIDQQGRHVHRCEYCQKCH